MSSTKSGEAGEHGAEILAILKKRGVGLSAEQEAVLRSEFPGALNGTQNGAATSRDVSSTATNATTCSCIWLRSEVLFLRDHFSMQRDQDVAGSPRAAIDDTNAPAGAAVTEEKERGLSRHPSAVRLSEKATDSNSDVSDGARQLKIDGRSPLTPEDCATLIGAGYRVVVEKSDLRAFRDNEYEQAGCEMSEPLSWITDAPADALVVGIRDFGDRDKLDENGGRTEYLRTLPLRHRHLFYAHAYNNQEGWQQSLTRFLEGGGELLDFEFLCDDRGARVASYGQLAGAVGMATGIIAWCRQVLAAHRSTDLPVDLVKEADNVPFEQFIEGLLKLATQHETAPKVVVIGSRGTSGTEAFRFARRMGLQVTGWTRKDTSSRGAGPFPELLNFDVLVNAVRLDDDAPVFLTSETVRAAPRALSVIVDISCDNKSPKNPLPIYFERTSFENPTVRILHADAAVGVAKPLDLVAVPNLASLLPRISSAHFSRQLLPHLLRLKDEGFRHRVWARCSERFWRVSRSLRPVKQQFPRVESDAYDTTLRQRELLAKVTSDAEPKPELIPVFRAYRASLPSNEDDADASSFDEHQFLQSLKGVLKRHEILYTKFAARSRLGADASALRPKIIEERTSRDVRELVTFVSRDDLDFDRLSAEELEKAASPSLALNEGRTLHITVFHTPGADAFVATVALHPLVADGFSADLLMGELLKAYRDGHYSLGERPVQFGDYAAFQRYTYDPEVEDQARHAAASHLPLEVDVKYWRKHLDASAPVLQIPTDMSRRSRRSPKCHRAELSLSTELTEKILAFSRDVPTARGQHDWNLYSVMLSAFSLVLFRRIHESDIVVSSVFSGREQTRLRRLLGPVDNQTHFRFSVDHHTRFQDLFTLVRREVVNAHQHRHVSFAELLSRIRSAEGASASANYVGSLDASLSPVLFSMSPELYGAWSPLRALCGDDAVCEELGNVQTLNSPMDISLHVSLNPRTSQLSLSTAFNASMFHRDSAAELLSQFEVLLPQLVAKPAEPITSYPLLTPLANKVLPSPRMVPDYGWPGSVVECFERIAKAHPERVALVYQGEPIVYKALQKKVNEVAAMLIQKGIKTGDVVNIYGHRSPPVVFAIMGVLKAGGAYSMIDPKYPTDRIEKCLTVAKPRGWISIAEIGGEPDDLKQFLSTLGLAVNVTLHPLNSAEDDKMFADIDHAKCPSVELSPDGPAVVTFTSGSTGLPKGVVGRHSSLTTFYPWMGETFGISDADRFSMCSGIAHDPLARDVFTPLFFGSSLYIPTDQDIVEPGRLAKWMRQYKITISCFTPAMGQILVSAVESDNTQLPDFRHAFFVGDMLIKRDVLKLRTLAPKVNVINMYGSTETQRAVGYYEVPFDSDLSIMKEVIGVGKGMKDAQCLILNRSGLLTGVAEMGEIFMRSPHMALGYLGLPKQTAERFVKNSLVDDPKDADRLYKTGDLGRYTLEGDVECAGRADEQVKIRGFRIELGEINAFLSKHEYVKENVTVVRQDGGSEKRLVSYVVPSHKFMNSGEQKEPDTSSLSTTLRAYVQEHLPSYMVPAAIVVLEVMPLTPNGKINRRGLPAPQQREAPKAVVAMTETEEVVSNMWMQRLRCSVGLRDDFFEMGGHSLLLTQIAFEMGKHFGKPIPHSLLLEHPTVQSYAKAVDEFLSDDTPKRDQGGEDEAADLESRAVLTPKIGASADPDAVPYEHAKGENDYSPLPAPKAVLLTGATGFVGAFLLAELLTQMPKTTVVMAMVRAKSERNGFIRLQKSLEAHQLWQKSFADRIVPIPGDLSLPQFGLTDEKWEMLASTVGMIFHNGAYVHWTFPYQQLKATNVDGTLRIFELASLKRIKPVHFVSTTSVFDTKHHQSQEVVWESDELPSSEGLSGGYPQTKWVAERIALKARESGVPTSIYRPGYVSGSSRSGVWNVDDFLCRLIKGSILIGSTPFTPQDQASHKVNMTPVDFVAASIVYLARHACSHNKSFNVIHPSSISYFDFFDQIRRFGYQLAPIPYEKWRTTLVKSIERSITADDTRSEIAGRANEINPLTPIVSILSPTWHNGLRRSVVYDSSSFAKCLQECARVAGGEDAAAGVPQCPEISSCIPHYLAYFIQGSFLQPPVEEGDTVLPADLRRLKQGGVLLSRTNRSR